MTIDANLVAAIAAVVAAGVAIVAVLIQIGLARFSDSVENLWRFYDQWYGAPMLRGRPLAATSLLEGGDAAAIVDVLGFFELLGYMVRKRGIDVEAAWSFFSDFALPYWVASRSYVDRDRQIDQTYWQDFEWLHKAMIRIESKKRHLSRTIVEPSAGAATRFLEQEARPDLERKGPGPQAWRRIPRS